MNTSALRICMALSLFLFNQAIAQTGQYQRQKAPPKTTEPKGAKSSAETTESPSGKVDVTDLEKKYWVPKDTEFQVVQNRTYSKANRVALTASVGTMLGEYYSSGRVYGLTGNYFFSERHGVQAQYLRFDTTDNETVDYFKSNYGILPDYGRIKAYYGVSYNWVPIYAKLSLLEKQIIYFDLSVSPGLGLTQYDQLYLSDNPGKKTAPTFALDIAQHFFLDKNFAIRLDFMNRLFNEEVMNARVPGQSKRTKLNHTIIIQGGVTFHF